MIHSIFLFSFFTISCTLCAMEKQKLAINPTTQQKINRRLIKHTGKNNLPRVTFLLQHNAQINAREAIPKSGRIMTPLIAACSSKPITQEQIDERLKLIAFLIEQGADTELTDDRSNTPLMIAISNKDVQVLELLKHAGAQVNCLSKIKSTVYHSAVEHDALESIAWLSQTNADMNMIDHTGMAPLHVAVHCEKPHAVNELLKHGARLDIQTQANSIPDAPESTLIPAGSTVFHLAAQNSLTNAIPLQRLLMYHALFAPQENPVSKEGLFAFLCTINRLSKVLYKNRFVTLMPYLASSLEPKSLIRILVSNHEKARLFARGILHKRMEFLQHIVSLADANGDTPYMIECKNKVKKESNVPDTLLLPGLYEEQFKAFVNAAKTNTINSLANTNIFKAAYYGKSLPQKQSLINWTLEAMQGECVIC